MSNKPHLLMYGIYYAPEGTGAAPYNTTLATSLAKRGWEVTVVTGIPHYPSWKREPYTDAIDPDGPHLIRRNHYVPQKQSVLRRGLYEASWLLSASTTAAPPRKVDVVLGVTPGLSGAAMGAAAAARYRVPFVMWSHDLIGQSAQQSGIGASGRVSGAIKAAEVGLARRAKRLAIFAEGYRAYFTSGGVDPEKIVRVRHWAHVPAASESRETMRARLGWKDSDFIVLHGGNMGFKQGLENVLHAADLARDKPGLRFVLQGDGNQRPHLEQMVAELGLKNVDFRPVAPQAEFQAVLGAADALLLNLRGTVEDMALPCKLTSYFVAGVPVVAAVSPTSEAATEVAAAKAGITVLPDHPAQMLEAIEALQRDPARATELGRSGRVFAADHMTEKSVIDSFEHILEDALH